MKVDLKVNRVDTTMLKASAVQAQQRALALTTDAARMDTRPYVPFLSGALAQTADTQSIPEQGKLIYGDGNRVPYARRQYYDLPGKNKATHSKATKQWFEVSKAANMRRWRDLMAREYNRGLKG